MRDVPKYPVNHILIIPRKMGMPVGVEITWLHALPNDGPLVRFLEETFDGPDGVEEVIMGRYSARILVADHIATVDEVAEHLYELLTDIKAQTFFAAEFPDGYEVKPPMTARRIKEDQAMGRYRTAT